jgi:calcineurin-like phosphoesterase family protein
MVKEIGKIIIRVIFVIGICGWFFIYIKLKINSRIFGNYLESIGDKDTLYKIGLMNTDGKRTMKDVWFTSVHEKLITKYNETKNNQYIIFDDIYMKYNKILMFFAVILFIIYCALVVIKKCNRS